MQLEKSQKHKYYKKYLKYFFVAVLIYFFNIILIDFVSIKGIKPDLLLILCVWIALSEGQFTGLLAAFGIGLIQDIVSFDVLGTNALAKLVTALIAGWFYNENKININLGTYKFLIIIFISSFFHNMIYYFLYIDFHAFSFYSFFIKYCLAISAYTTLIAVFPMLLKIPKNRLIR
jgi:rod shape-determining protein MreD